MNSVRTIFAFILILAILTASFYYVGRRIFQTVVYIFPSLSSVLFICIYLVLVATVILGRFTLPPAINSIVDRIGAYWLGLFIYLLLFFIAADLVLVVGRVAKLIPADMLQSFRFYARAASITLSVVVVCIGIVNANKIATASYDVRLSTDKSDGVRIVLVSDLHLGDIGSEKRIERIVDAINLQEPDIVCIAGDIFTGSFYRVKNPDRVSELFKSIEATYGVYACLGNHDGGGTMSEIVDFLERSGVKLLREDFVTLDDRLVLAGRVDPSPIGGRRELSRGDFSDVIAQAPPGLPVVVMDHSPGNIDQYGDEADLILCGHTHGGQLIPVTLVTKAIYDVNYGYYRKDADSPHVIVTQGAGTWMMPIRVGTRSEIAVITLH